MNVYTAGHSTSSLEQFVELLVSSGIDVVVDVRSKPRSRLSHFDMVPLQEAVEDAGMTYRFAGDRLGGVPRDPRVQARWKQGHLDPVIVAHLRSTDEWTDGVAEVARLLRAGKNVCLICSEADPAECHRTAVALDVADAAGATVTHLRVSGSAPTEVGVQEVMM
jgi:uncharacterized protein (DUF488 family)